MLAEKRDRRLRSRRKMRRRGLRWGLWKRLAAIGVRLTQRRGWPSSSTANRCKFGFSGAIFCRRGRRFEEALVELEAATELDGNDAQALTTTGWGHYCKRSFDGALQCANAATYFAPRYGPAHLLAAAAAFGIGMTAEGETSCREALLISPEDPWARAIVGDPHTDSKVITASVPLRTDRRTAIDRLEEAVNEGDSKLLKLRWPLFNPLSEDECFDLAVRRTFNG